jgi:lipopolysaccharide transport system ATP-binding protein
MDEIVAFAEIEKFIDTPVKHYSSGMSVRLGFSVAAHLTPEILLVDEVLAVGDIAFQKKCLGKMGDVSRQGRTIFLVSHRMSAIRSLCQTVYWMEGGRLRAAGPVDEMIAAYEKGVLEETRSSKLLNALNTEHGVEICAVDTKLETEGGEGNLRLTVQGRTTRPVNQLSLGLELMTLDGVIVARIRPFASDQTLLNLNGDFACEFEFADFAHRVPSGDYIVRLLVTRPQFGIILYIDNAALVKVPLSTAFTLGPYTAVPQHGLIPLPMRFRSPNMQTSQA